MDFFVFPLQNNGGVEQTLRCIYCSTNEVSELVSVSFGYKLFMFFTCNEQAANLVYYTLNFFGAR